ncbi:signal transduction histidine kinase [Echinicola vietnamensis DSM 17526]|uniref:histidine kinase n=2 Tax=Echinicola TaxID=390846 RepID=L0FVE9_ECHVK|nr:signal transduction histidine kinase [Echinicola vietnamensis DSM 17526]
MLGKGLLINTLVVLGLLIGGYSFVSGQSSMDTARLERVLEASKGVINRDIRDSMDFDYILELENFYHQIEDPLDIVKASRYLGIYYRSIFYFQDSEKYILNGMRLAKSIEEWGLYLELAKELATVYRSLGEYDKLKAEMDYCLKISQRYQVKSKELIPLMELALYNSYDIQNYEQGIVFGKRFLERAEYHQKMDAPDPMLDYRVATETVIIKIELAKCYIKTEQKFDLVKSYLDEAKYFFEPYGDQEKLSRIYEEYLNYYLKLGDLEAVKASLEKYNFHLRMSKQQFVQRTHEIPVYLKELSNLEQELEMTQMKNRRLNLEKQLYIGLIVLILVLMGTYFYLALRNRRIQMALNESLMAQNKLLENVSRDKSKFFSVVSHELRTPVYAITGLTSVMDVDKVVPQQIKAIKHSGDYLLLLINNILQMMNFEQGQKDQSKPNKSYFDLSEILADVIDSAHYFAQQNEVDLLLNTTWEGPMWVKGERQKLMQVLLNLIINGIKYSGDSKVVLSVEKVGAEDNAGKFNFKVSDNGIGIPKEQQEKMFNFMDRIGDQDSSHNPFDLHGVGIGLFVVEKLLQEMDSKIHLRSEEGEGATFSFELLMETNKNEVTVRDAELSPKKEGLHILVVDDSDINLMVAERLVTKLGYKCFKATDSDDVVSIILKEKIHLVLMDLNMPSISGYALSRKIKEVVDVPIIAHTAVMEEELDRKLMEDSGIQGYIIKPYSLPALKKILYENITEETQ